MAKSPRPVCWWAGFAFGGFCPGCLRRLLAGGAGLLGGRPPFGCGVGSGGGVSGCSWVGLPAVPSTSTRAITPAQGGRLLPLSLFVLCRLVVGLFWGAAPLIRRDRGFAQVDGTAGKPSLSGGRAGSRPPDRRSAGSEPVERVQFGTLDVPMCT